MKNPCHKRLVAGQTPKVVSPGPVKRQFILLELALEKKAFAKWHDPAKFMAGWKMTLGQKVGTMRAGLDRLTETDKLEVRSGLEQYFAPLGYQVKRLSFKGLEETTCSHGIFRYWEVIVEVS